MQDSSVNKNTDNNFNMLKFLFKNICLKTSVECSETKNLWKFHDALVVSSAETRDNPD